MRKVVRISLWILGSVFVLLLVVVIWLNTGMGKEFVKNKLVAFLQDKIKTEVRIGELGYGLPKYISLSDVLIKDEANDTLLAVKHLRVNINMLQLISGKVDVQKVTLEGVNSHIYRNAPDTNFNFTYIINAFAGAPKQEKVEDTTKGKPMAINVNKVELKDIRARFDDETGGMSFAINLADLQLKMKNIDLEAMSFHVKELSVEGLTTVLRQDTSYLIKDVDTTTEATPLQIIADNIHLQNINFSYGDEVGKFFFDINLGKLLTKVKNFDLAASNVAVDKLELDNTTATVRMGKVEIDKAAEEVVKDIDPDSANAGAMWKVLATQLKLNNVNFVLEDENAPRQQYGMDYAHLNVQNVSLQAKDIVYTTDTISGNIAHLSLKEHSGFDLKELKTVFAYHNSGAYLKDLYLETANTVLQEYIAIQYPSLKALQNNPETMLVNARLLKSVIGLADVLIFVPDLRKQDLFKKYGNEQLDLEAVLTGYLDKLDIKKFYLSGLHNTVVNVNGKLNGLPDADKLNYDLNITQLQSSSKDVTAIVPPSALEQVRVPDVFTVKGRIKGTTQDYNPDVVVVSSDGALRLKGYVYMSPGKGREKYDIHLNTDALNVGRILKQDSLLGAITAVINAKGSSFDINTMNAVVAGDISSLGLMGYNYSGLSLNGKVADKLANVAFTSTDPNAVLQLQADADFTQKDPALKALLNIDSINLYALHLSKEQMRINTQIVADFTSLNADYQAGTVSINKTIIATDSQRYVIDSLNVLSAPTADSGQNITVKADALNASITGKTPLTQIGNIVQEHISRHYNLSADTIVKKDTTVLVKKVPATYNLNVNAVIQDRPLLRVLLPGLEAMDSIVLNAAIDQTALRVEVDAPHIVYSGNTLDSAKVRLNGTDSALTYMVSLNKLTTPAIALWQTTATGELDGRDITTNITIADSAQKERFSLSATLKQADTAQVLQLGDKLVLNYKTWQVSQPNKIVLSSAGFYAQNFGFSNGAESVKLYSDAEQYTSPLHVDINNFLISNITEIVQKDTLLVNGVLNTKLIVQNATTAPQASGTLDVKNIAVRNDTIGNLGVVLTEASANEVDAKITIDGNGNDIQIAGSYYPKPVNNNNFDLKVDINNLSVKSIEGLTMNQVRNSSGGIKGNMLLQGTLTEPVLTGNLQTADLKTTISMLGMPFSMPAEKIVFTKEGITFDNFKMLDSLGNKGTLSGKIITKDYSNMGLALKLNSKEWQVLNSTAKNSELFYGRMIVSTNLSINGTVLAPVIDGKLTIHDSTKFTVVIPQSKAGLEEREGVIEFVDMDDSGKSNLFATVDTTSKMALRKGAKMDVNIDIEREAEFNVIIDATTGDFLSVRGEAALNTSINPDGTIGLTGNYELKQGAYELNYNLIKRRFNIQEGSTIKFAGDPLDAEADIVAAYTANVPPYDLVEREVTDQTQLVYYKQRLPFDVQLKMKGPLLKPEITFDIVLPEERNMRANSDVLTLVQGKLTQLRNNTSELNKQVFALLILNRFVAENPFESGAGGQSAEFIARQSASRFLSEQLNAIAGQLVNGLELNLGLESYEDYTTGNKRNRTDLNVSASKRLFNDRLTVTIGNNFEVEGQNQNNNQNTSLVPGNLAADYQLTKDGRYKVRIYRQNETQDIIQGFVVETGVSFIVTVDYNRFRTLFQKRSKRYEKLDNNAEDTKKSGVSN